MKPKTKIQKEIVALSNQLAPITKCQQTWAYEHCLEHLGRWSSRGTMYCLECGYVWIDKNLEPGICICPQCNKKIELLKTRKQKFRQIKYFCIITTNHGFQVLRYFYLYFDSHIGTKSHTFCKEVAQCWVLPSGKIIPISLRYNISFYSMGWSFDSNLEPRTSNVLFDIVPDAIYPRSRTLPEIHRNGFKRSVPGIPNWLLFSWILRDRYAETLLKTKQYPLLQHLCKVGITPALWVSIRICIRNNYYVEDVIMWVDYVELLSYFGKDCRNAKYVCPTSLKKEHDLLMIRRKKNLGTTT